MKNIFTMITISFLAFSFVGCEEKSDVDKAKDSMSNAFEKSKDAIHDATK